MTKEQLADIINGKEHSYEIDSATIQEAKENSLIILYGYSDDNLEVEGAINDEYGCYEGGEFLLVKKGEMCQDDEDEDTFHRAKDSGLYDASRECDVENNPRLIKVEWSDMGVTWRINTNMPHAKFNILEGGEVWCEGIIIDLNEIETFKYE